VSSLNLQRYLQARADGGSVGEACAASGIGAGEAQLHERDIERGELTLPRAGARAPARAHTRENSTEEVEVANGTVAADELRLLIERIERLKEEIKGLNEDVSDVYGEAKSRGFDTAAMKSVIKIRKLEPQVRQEKEAILALYLDAVGLSADDATIALAA
jgi:uncharacterized protein (UPF0335 family)